MSARLSVRSVVVTLVGAAVGGLVGYFAFQWVLGQGLYGLVLPGGLMGFGASFGRSRSAILAALVGAAALSLGLFAEWRFFPFNADGSLGYFLTHLHQLKPITWLMLVVGTVIGVLGPLDLSGRMKAAGRGGGLS